MTPGPAEGSLHPFCQLQALPAPCSTPPPTVLLFYRCLSAGKPAALLGHLSTAPDPAGDSCMRRGWAEVGRVVPPLERPGADTYWACFMSACPATANQVPLRFRDLNSGRGPCFPGPGGQQKEPSKVLIPAWGMCRGV